MSVHASEQNRNVERTVFSHLASTGLDLVPAADKRFNSTTRQQFVRVSLQPMDETPAGRVAGARASRATGLVVAECYARDGADKSVSSTDAVVALAENVAAALRYLDLPLLDYVSDPTGATAVSGVAVRFTVPRTQFLEPDADGWDRRIVSSVGTWFPRHS